MAFLDNVDNLEETQTLEFKEATAGLPNDIWETYSAFANTEGGEIVLGVEEDRDANAFHIVGVVNANDLIDQFWTTIRNPEKISSDIIFPDGISIENVGEHELVIIKVPRAPKNEKPVRIRIKREYVAFVRRGSTDQRATEAEIRLMEYDKTDLADRIPLNEVDISALDTRTIFRYRNIATAINNSRPWSSDSNEDFLFHIGAVAKGRDGVFHPTKAGLLAFGFEHEISNAIPHYRLDYREETEENLRWTDRIMSQDGNQNGNLIDFYLAVSNKIKQLFKAPFATDETGMQHKSRNPITECVNEAIVNALVHGWYGADAAVTVIVGENKITVTNSGSLLLDKQVAIAGGITEQRNPTLMRIFNYIGAGDQAGSGLFTIWNTWNKVYGKEPLLTESHGPSCVKLSLPVESRTKIEHSDKTFYPADKALLIEAIREAIPSGGITASQASEATRLSVRKAQSLLLELTNDGESGVTRVKKGRSFYYLIKGE